MTTTYFGEPDLLEEARRNDACCRLAEWLAACGDARGDGLWMEVMEFFDARAAVDWAARLRARLGGCYRARWVGVSVHGTDVHIRIIAACETQSSDAIEPDWPVGPLGPPTWEMPCQPPPP